MRSPRIQLTALVLLAAFVFGFAHCTLDGGCAEESSGSATCQICLCHSPAIAEATPVTLLPNARAVDCVIEAFTPNARLASVSIFDPPEA